MLGLPNSTFLEFIAYAGAGQLKEWILLEEGEKAPRIRTGHSLTLLKYEGTRKRRREHQGSYVWETGDHVDAWIRDRQGCFDLFLDFLVQSLHL